jgi:hypothetical protein
MRGCGTDLAAVGNGAALLASPYRAMNAQPALLGPA